MRVLIGGDVVPTDLNRACFEAGDAEAVLGTDLKKIWDRADLRMFNMECPVTDAADRIVKNGPSLRAGKGCLKGIAALRPDLVFLGNNHILDAGEKGLKDLMDSLEDLDIPYVGAGRDLSSVRRSALIEKDGTVLGIVNCCDTEFSLARPGRAGAAGCGPETLEEIARVKRGADRVIVIYHGGKEYYRYPSPALRRLCRSFADAGADLVLCQHSHCIGAEEKYGQSLILYGQGNFIFNKKDDAFWHTSLLADVTVGDDMKVEWLPIVRTDKGTRLADEPERAEILRALDERSAEAADDGNVDKKFAGFSSGLLPAYLYTFAGWGRLRRALDMKLFGGRLIGRHYSRGAYAAMWNFIACDAHREVLLRGLEDMMNGSKEDRHG